MRSTPLEPGLFSWCRYSEVARRFVLSRTTNKSYPRCYFRKYFYRFWQNKGVGMGGEAVVVVKARRSYPTAIFRLPGLLEITELSSTRDHRPMTYNSEEKGIDFQEASPTPSCGGASSPSVARATSSTSGGPSFIFQPLPARMVSRSS